MQIKTGPFIRSPITIERIMIDVLISLLPVVAAGAVFFGWRALLVILLSTTAAIAAEAVLLKAPLTPRGVFGDGSAAVTGLLLGLTLPVDTAWWIPVVGSILAIVLVKMAFGGLGYNIFNPALGARAILLLAFTSQMVKFRLPFEAVSGATPLFSSSTYSTALFWGNVGGSIGETSVVAILLGGIYLFYRGHIDWRIPISYVGSAFALAVLWGLDPWYTIAAGGLLFAAIFMATDMVTSPVTPAGQLIFGAGCGILTLVIRQFTSLPEGVTFAVLTMNALAPAIESLTIPNAFGVGASREARRKGAALSLAALLAVIGIFAIFERIQPTAVPVISHNHYLPLGDLLGTSDYETVDEGGVRYYVARDTEGNALKTVFTAEQEGFNGPIHFLLVLDHKGEIEKVQVLAHQEDPGLGELITKSSFLEQFAGLGRQSDFSLGAEIQGITGATVSSRSFTAGVRRSLENFGAVFYPEEKVDEPIEAWADGTYSGQADSFGGPLKVEVAVQNGKITAVRVLEHSDTPNISDGAIEKVPQAIVAANSPRVDTVAGATVSSESIMRAVQSALAGVPEEQGDVETEPALAPYEISVADGVYRGIGQGYGGDLVLEVAISGGSISDIAVIESGETPFIADRAFQQMFPALIEAQGPVDEVSGATATSKAILEALSDALGLKEGE